MKKFFYLIVSFSIFCVSCSSLSVGFKTIDTHTFSPLESTENEDALEVTCSDNADYNGVTEETRSLDDCLDVLHDKWYKDAKQAIDTLNNYRQSSLESACYCFFTDPHFFWPYADSLTQKSFIFDYMGFLKCVSNSSNSDFVICGGDLLNNGDSISQACNNLSYFNNYAKSLISNYYYIVGNHDTNYQGDSFISQGDSNSCLLDNETIERLMFDGNKTYYSFETETTKYFCFNSGIDWDSGVLNLFRIEQVHWFANELTNSKKPHSTIFIHIPTINGVLTALMHEIGNIVEAYNTKKCLTFNGNFYDFSQTIGKVDYIQSGHLHSDINLTCGGIPVIVTTSFSHPSVVSRPTFDLVFADYSNSIVHCLRVGEGEHRDFAI